MRLHTIQMAKWRKTPEGCKFKDITYKSGDKVFAPSADLLWSFKRGELTEDQYTQIYMKEMRQSFVSNKQQWMDILNEEYVAIACYCPAGKLCHRLIMKSILNTACDKFGIPFEYLGEVE